MFCTLVIKMHEAGEKLDASAGFGERSSSMKKNRIAVPEADL